MVRLWLGLCTALAMTHAVAQSTPAVRLHAAGSLRVALGEVAQRFEQQGGAPVSAVWGASGLLRDRLAGGEPSDVFASANMAHPKSLHEAGRAGPVRRFAGNRLCALTSPALDLVPDKLLDAMLDAKVKLGTSTLKADPSGDYAWEVFRRAEAQRPGAFEQLAAKAKQLTGGPNSPAPPAQRNLYAMLVERGDADLFLTYCTNALLAQREVPALRIVQLPPALAVGADYGLVVLNGAPPAAAALADFITGPVGREVLLRHGFDVEAPAR
jgi:molybdate transport system substrate-binding protein